MKKIMLIIISMLITLMTGCESIAAKVTFELQPGQDTILVGSQWQDAGIKVFRNDVELTVVSDLSDLDTSTIGTYEVLYRATYGSTTYRYTRYVQVIDGIAPVMILNPGIDTIFVGQPWIDTGVTVNDAIDGELNYDVFGEVNINLVGNYTITYVATDLSGNESRIIRIVSVIEPSNDILD